MDVAEFAKSKPAELKQPFLVALGKKQDPDNYFIILDNIAMPVGNHVLVAMYRLFCAFWVFAVEYFPRLSPFYNFLEVVCIDRTPKCSVRSLLSGLRSSVASTM